jgi:hypothetical protein
MFIHIYFLPLHVLALVGHLQAEYTIIAAAFHAFIRHTYDAD